MPHWFTERSFSRPYRQTAIAASSRQLVCVLGGGGGEA